MTNEQLLAHSESLAELVSRIGMKLKQLSQSVGEQVNRSVDVIRAQRSLLEEFADAEARSMKKTTEEMIQVWLQYRCCSHEPWLSTSTLQNCLSAFRSCNRMLHCMSLICMLLRTSHSLTAKKLLSLFLHP